MWVELNHAGSTEIVTQSYNGLCDLSLQVEKFRVNEKGILNPDTTIIHISADGGYMLNLTTSKGCRIIRLT